jgi:phospholipid transport system substrate-binding protein
MKKTLLSLSLLLIFITNSAHANLKGLDHFIYNFTDKIFNRITEKEDLNMIRERIINQIRNNIDINYIAKFVLGKNWRRLTPGQRANFTKLYENYLIYSYAPKFRGYRGETYKILPSRELAPYKYIASIDLMLTTGKKLNLRIFVVWQEKQGFKIVDVSGAGISFATTQRSEFSAAISQMGVHNFIERLEKKVLILETEYNNETNINKSVK